MNCCWIIFKHLKIKFMLCFINHIKKQMIYSVIFKYKTNAIASNLITLKESKENKDIKLNRKEQSTLNIRKG